MKGTKYKYGSLSKTWRAKNRSVHGFSSHLSWSCSEVACGVSSSSSLLLLGLRLVAPKPPRRAIYKVHIGGNLREINIIPVLRRGPRLSFFTSLTSCFFSLSISGYRYRAFAGSAGHENEDRQKLKASFLNFDVMDCAPSASIFRDESLLNLHHLCLPRTASTRKTRSRPGSIYSIS